MYITKMVKLRRARMNYKNGKISSDKLIGIIKKQINCQVICIHNKPPA